MGKIYDPLPPVKKGTAVHDFDSGLCTSNEDLIDAIQAVFPAFTFVSESTGYIRFDEPWFFAGRTQKGILRVGPKTYAPLARRDLYLTIPSLQPWKIVKPIHLIGSMRVPA